MRRLPYQGCLIGLLFLTLGPVALAEMPPQQLGDDSLRCLDPKVVLRYAPDDANALVFAKVDAVLISPATEQLCRRYETFSQIRREVTQEAWLQAEELSSALMIGDTNSPRPIMVMQSLRPTNLEQILRTRRADETFFAEEINGHKMFVPTENDWSLSAAQIDSHTLLLGRSDELRESLRRGRPAKLKPLMREQVESLNYSLPFCMMFDATSMPEGMKDELTDELGVPEAIFKKVKGFKLEVRLDEPLVAIGSALCDKPKTAQEVQQTVKFVLGMAKLAGTIPNKALPLVKALEFDSQENVAQATWKMPLKEAHKHLEGIFPRVPQEQEEHAAELP